MAVALGATCTLDMTDTSGDYYSYSYGDGWNGAEWAAPGFGQRFSLEDGNKGTKSFVVQFQPPSPPPAPPAPPSPPPLPPPCDDSAKNCKQQKCNTVYPDSKKKRCKKTCNLC